MMLYVNGEEITEIVLGLFTLTDGKAAFVKEPETFPSSPEEFLAKLVAYLKREKIEFLELEGIAIASGAGSATALRTSHTIVNAMRFMSGVPLYFVVKGLGVSDSEALTRTVFEEREFIAPVYGRAPTITTSEKDALRR